MTNRPPRQLSDAELRKRELKTSDPCSQDGLVEAIPDGSELDALENTYHVSVKLPKVRCAACGRRLHRRGYTGRLGSGELVLLGSKCGSEVFGAWQEGEHAFNVLEDRQYSLLHIDELTTLTPQIRRKLVIWRLRLEEADAARTALEDTMPDLYGMLAAAALSPDGALTTTRRVQTRTVPRSGPIKIGFRYETRNHGPVPGAAFFEVDTCARRLDQVVEALDLLEQIAAVGTDGFTNMELLEARKTAERAGKALQRVHAALRATAEFFSAEGLKSVVAWTAINSELFGSYSTSDRTLIWEDEVKVALAPSFVAPLGDILGSLEKRPTPRKHEAVA